MISLTVPQWLNDLVPKDGKTHAVHYEVDYEASGKVERGFIDGRLVLPGDPQYFYTLTHDELERLNNWVAKQVGLDLPAK